MPQNKTQHPRPPRPHLHRRHRCDAAEYSRRKPTSTTDNGDVNASAVTHFSLKSWSVKQSSLRMTSVMFQTGVSRVTIAMGIDRASDGDPALMSTWYHTISKGHKQGVYGRGPHPRRVT